MLRIVDQLGEQHVRDLRMSGADYADVIAACDRAVGEAREPFAAIGDQSETQRCRIEAARRQLAARHDRVAAVEMAAVERMERLTGRVV